MGFNGDLYPTAGADVVMTTSGDMIKYESGARARLGIGSANQILQVKSSLPSWETLSTAGSVLTTQGDILYESASGLARLGQSTDGFVLTTKGAGANPVWASAGGGGNMELVGSDILTSAGSTLQVAISPAINQSDIAYLRLVVNVKADDATAEAQDTILRVNSISTGTYNQDGIECRAGSSSILNDVAHDYVKVANNNHDGNRFSITDLVCNSASENIEMNIAGGGADGYFTAFAYNSTGSQTTFSDITVLAGGGNNAINSRIDVYKVTK